MFRNAQRPRVAALLTLLVVLTAVVFGVVGLIVGKGSVDEGASSAEPARPAGETAAASREQQTVRTSLEARIGKLETSESSWRTRATRAEQALERRRARA
ncbi:MAG: hypothetical protein ACRDLN_05430, partial [Solirubrobacteraceae bacterium]